MFIILFCSSPEEHISHTDDREEDYYDHRNEDQYEYRQEHAAHEPARPVRGFLLFRYTRGSLPGDTVCSHGPFPLLSDRPFDIGIAAESSSAVRASVLTVIFEHRVAVLTSDFAHIYSPCRPQFFFLFLIILAISSADMLFRSSSDTFDLFSSILSMKKSASCGLYCTELLSAIMPARAAT